MAGQVPPPPPNMPSGRTDEGTVQALIEWLWAFYNSVVTVGYYATQASLTSLEDIVDPATATAATAQETANTALSLATSNGVRLDAVKAGSVTIADAATSGDVTFTAALEDINYHVTAMPTAKVGSPAAGSRDVDICTKATDKVTITLQAAPGAGNSVTFDVMAIRPQ